jgi:hypothetical protein
MSDVWTLLYHTDHEGGFITDVSTDPEALRAKAGDAEWKQVDDDEWWADAGPAHSLRLQRWTVEWTTIEPPGPDAASAP